MARSLVEYQEHLDDRATPVNTDHQARRSTARAFAAAISAFAISALVITTSSEALEATGTETGNTITSGTISLSDDDNGGALFTLEDMAPNRPSTECIEIVYEGTILPVDMTMSTSATGDLPPYLLLTVETGSGGQFSDCSSFVADGVLFDGTLAEMSAAGAAPVVRFRNRGDAHSFRLTFEMVDEQAAVGLGATARFTWEASPP